jgi:hypothetical protein
MEDIQPRKRLLRNTDLANRYGRTQRTIDRWKDDKTLPAADIVIRGIPYWYEETIEANERTHLSNKASDQAA